MSLLNEMLDTHRKENPPPYYGYDYETIDCEHEIVMACEQYNDIESDFNALDRLEEIHCGLEQLLWISQDSLQEGGLYAFEASMLHYGHQALLEPLGLEAPILGIESFGAKGERFSSTRVSIEEEKGTLTKIWEAIKRALTALTEKLKAWYNNIFNVADKLKDKFDAMKKTVEGLGSKTITGDKDVEFSSGALLSKGQTELNLKTNLANLESEANSFLKDNTTRSTITEMIDAVEKVDFKAGKVDDAWSKGFEPFLKKIMQISKTKSSKSDIPSVMNAEGMVVTKYDELPGNKAIYAYSTDVGIFDVDKIAKFGYKIGPFKDDNAIKDKVKYKVLSVGDLKTNVELGIRLVEIIINFKKSNDTVNDIKERIKKVGDKISDASKDNAASGKKAINILRQTDRFLNNPANSLTNLIIKTLSSLLNLMNAMIKSYS